MITLNDVNWDVEIAKAEYIDSKNAVKKAFIEMDIAYSRFNKAKRKHFFDRIFSKIKGVKNATTI